MNKNVVKAIVAILLVLIIEIGIYLSINQNSEDIYIMQEESVRISSDKKVLIAYFSQKGNTELMAEQIWIVLQMK